MSSFPSIADYSLPNLDKITVPDLIVVAPPSGILSWIAPCVSFICAIAGTYAAWRIGSKAREITNQQKDIAAQSKKIAQDKLELDIFDKRYAVINAYEKLYAKCQVPILTISDIQNYVTEFQEKHTYFSILFSKDDYKMFIESRRNLYELMRFRNANKNQDIYSKNLKEKYASLNELCRGDILNLRNILLKYSPDLLKRVPTSGSPTTRPASPDTPPPTAPEADQ